MLSSARELQAVVVKFAREFAEKPGQVSLSGAFVSVVPGLASAGQSAETGRFELVAGAAPSGLAAFAPVASEPATELAVAGSECSEQVPRWIAANTAAEKLAACKIRIVALNA